MLHNCCRWNNRVSFHYLLLHATKPSLLILLYLQRVFGWLCHLIQCVHSTLFRNDFYLLCSLQIVLVMCIFSTLNDCATDLYPHFKVIIVINQVATLRVNPCSPLFLLHDSSIASVNSIAGLRQKNKKATRQHLYHYTLLNTFYRRWSNTLTSSFFVILYFDIIMLGTVSWYSSIVLIRAAH